MVASSEESLSSCFNIKLGFVQSCSSQEQTIMCGHVNAGTNGNGCIHDSGNHYVYAITGYHIAQFFPESEPQLKGPLDSPDFAKNKTWLFFGGSDDCDSTSWTSATAECSGASSVSNTDAGQFPFIFWCWQQCSDARLNLCPQWECLS